jgi:hypothetical protein
MVTSADLFSLDVFVSSVRDSADRAMLRRSSQVAVACRFLDYPPFYIEPHPSTSAFVDGHTRVFRMGKSCMLSEEEAHLRGLVEQVCAVHSCGHQQLTKYDIVVSATCALCDSGAW